MQKEINECGLFSVKYRNIIINQKFDKDGIQQLLLPQLSFHFDKKNVNSLSHIKMDSRSNMCLNF